MVPLDTRWRPAHDPLTHNSQLTTYYTPHTLSTLYTTHYTLHPQTTFSRCAFSAFLASASSCARVSAATCDEGMR
jgi:hypothetical protein